MLFELSAGRTSTDPTSLFTISLDGVLALSVKSRVSTLLVLVFSMLFSVLLLLLVLIISSCELEHAVIAENILRNRKSTTVVAIARCIVFFNLFLFLG